MPANPPDARDILDLIDRTKRQLRRTWLASGTALLVLAGVGWLLIAAMVDLLMPLPVMLRLVAWAVFWLLIAGTLIAAVLWPLLKPLPPERVARRIEKTLPTMKNRLLSTLDLSSRQRNGNGVSAVFYERLLEQTRQRLEPYRIEHVASPIMMKRGLITAGIVVLLAVALTGLLHDRMPTAMARVLRPTAPIPPVSWAKLAATGDLTVLRGEPLTLETRIERGRIDSLTLWLRPEGGDWARYPMHRLDDKRFAFELSSVDQSYEYQVVGGGTWTRPHRITALARPVIRDVAATVHLPEYMGLPDPRPVDERAGQIAAPIGSHVELAAVVEHATDRGQLIIHQARSVEQTVREDRERVWFDDAPPADAHVTAEPRMRSDQVHSGSRAFLLDGDRPALAFETRLSGFDIMPDQRFFFYLRPDPRQPAATVRATLHVEGRRQPLQWAIEPNGEHPPGQWRRVEISLGQLHEHYRDHPAKLTGLRIEAEGGRAMIDRVGAVQRIEETVARSELVEHNRVDLVFDATRDRWVGRIEVEADMYLSMQLTNALGHASQPMRPIPVLARTDQAPTVLIEKPVGSVTLAEAQAVPIIARAMDDWGIEAVGIAWGDSADSVGEPRWVQQYDEPRTNRVVTVPVNPEHQGVGPGQAMHYRMIVRDRKGQIGMSEPLRLALASPESERDTAVAQRVPLLSNLLEGLGKLLEVQAGIVTAPLELLAQLPEGTSLELAEDDTLLLQAPDGQPLTDQLDSLTDQQREALTQLAQALRDRQDMMDQISQALGTAARQADDSPTALPMEAEALRAMRQQLDAMAAQGMSEEDQAVAQRLAQLQQQQLEQLQQQLAQLQAAHEQFGDNPDAAQQQLAAMLAQLHAAQTARQLSELQQHLAQQQQRLDQLAQQVAALQQQTRDATTAGELDQVSQQQQEVDPQAIEAIRDTQQLLAQAQREEPQFPPAPWTPPGQTREAHPIEQDTPEEAPRQAERADADTAPPPATAQADEDEGNWWDQPVPTPPTPATVQAQERFADRQRPVEPPPAADAAAAAQTPRQMLEEHQDQMHQQLTQNSNDLARAAGQAQQMAQAMDMMAAMPMTPGAMAQMGQMMNSPAMASMQAMAQTAAMQAAMAEAGADGGESGEGGQAQDGRGSQPPSLTGMPSLGPDGVFLQEGGVILQGELANLPAGSRAALYRLPPQLRQPLMQGMNEKGPEGYQPLIDAYYRQLIEESRP